MTGFIETSLDGGVFTATLADEARRNALSTELVGELVEALDAAEADPDVRVIVVTNRGNTFCAGANLAQQSSTTAPVDTAAISHVLAGLGSEFTRPEVYATLRSSPKDAADTVVGVVLRGLSAPDHRPPTTRRRTG